MPSRDNAALPVGWLGRPPPFIEALEELDDREAEADQGCCRAHPGHERALDTQPCAQLGEMRLHVGVYDKPICVTFRSVVRRQEASLLSWPESPTDPH